MHTEPVLAHIAQISDINSKIYGCNSKHHNIICIFEFTVEQSVPGSKSSCTNFIWPTCMSNKETHHHKDIEIATPLNSTCYRLVINKTISLHELPKLKQAYTHIHTDNFGCTTPSSRTALLNQISNAKFSQICPQLHCSHVTRIMA